MPWYKRTKNSEGRNYPEQDFLVHHEQIENGTFWYDEIRKLRGENHKRLSAAMSELPLPAAFREAAIALRGIIKEKKKAGTNYVDELLELYKLACVRSFMLDYSEKVKIPGYNIMVSIPGGMLFSLKIDYTVIGYQKLELLNKTDIKDIVKVMGEPNRHCSMNEVYRDLWIEYEMKEMKNW